MDQTRIVYIVVDENMDLEQVDLVVDKFDTLAQARAYRKELRKQDPIMSEREQIYMVTVKQIT